MKAVAARGEAKNVGQHDGAANRYNVDVAEELTFCDVAPAEVDVLGSIAKAHVMAESGSCCVILVENGGVGL